VQADSGRGREANVNDLTLFLAVIRESAKYTSLHYPHSEFSVILWDGRDDARLALIEQELKKGHFGSQAHINRARFRH
jgi:hypothetical protein